MTSKVSCTLIHWRSLYSMDSSWLWPWMPSTKNNDKCFSIHLLGQEIAKKKKTISHLVLATENKTLHCFIDSWPFHWLPIIWIPAGGSTTSFHPLVFRQLERGTTQTGFGWSVFQRILLLWLSKNTNKTLCLTIQRWAGDRTPEKSWSLNLLKDGLETRFLRKPGH